MHYSLIVFDLDFTLWNAGGTWCDHTCPPYRKQNGHILDACDSVIRLYPDSREILEKTSQLYPLAIASRTHEPGRALELMSLFNIRQYFRYIEIYPGSKTEHFKQLQAKSRIPFKAMLFFDDELRNINEVSRLQAHAVLVDNGIDRETVKPYLNF